MATVGREGWGPDGQGGWRMWAAEARLSRRGLLKLGAAGAAAPVADRLSGWSMSASASAPSARPGPDVEEASIADLAAAMQAGRLDASDIVESYLARIDALDRDGPTLASVLEVNPDAERIAARLDDERRTGNLRGPLHGIPILLKDNIDTADAMETTAGSLALLGSRPRRDATAAARLRDAGAVLLGKTNLSEWANMRSSYASSGWSARGGVTRNPNVTDRTASGSSSGSAVAAAASLAAAALGTETDGSIVLPASVTGVVGLKPTVGLTSRAGVIPISKTQDSVGVLGRTVADVATVLTALVGPDSRDQATSSSPRALDYRQFLRSDGLAGARIGIPPEFRGYSEHADAVMAHAAAVLREAGAIVVDDASLPAGIGAEEGVVLQYEFKDGINAYLADRGHPQVRSLEDLIGFNDANADRELEYFGQDTFHKAQARGPLTDAAYRDAREHSWLLARRDGIDAVMDRHRLDALLTPTAAPAGPLDLVNGECVLLGTSTPAAVAGYPIVTVPAGSAFGLPMGVSFFGRAWSEPVLLRLAYAFERAADARRPPQYRAHNPGSPH